MEITEKKPEKENQEIYGQLQKKFVSVSEGAALYSMGATNFRNLAEKAGAMYKVGEKRILVNIQIFEEYLEQCRVKPE